jgi:hypothetical protein
MAGFSLVFGVVRDFTDGSPGGQAEFYEAVLVNE